MEYDIASTDEHYEACQELMSKENEPYVKLKFPTIMAFKGEELIGFMGTHYQDELVIGGPLVLESSKRHPRAAIMLSQFYDIAMRSLKVKSYIMHADDGNFVDRFIKRYNPPGLEEYAREGSKTFYIRRL